MTACYRCHRPGHYADSCPDSIPAASKDEHLARIDAYVEDWIEGRITIDQTRRAISDENRLYYGDACPRKLTWP